MGSKFLKKESEDRAKAMSLWQLWMLVASDRQHFFKLHRTEDILLLVCNKKGIFETKQTSLKVERIKDIVLKLVVSGLDEKH